MDNVRNSLHCKCMKNNAFRQTNVTFFEAQNTHLAPNKSTPTRGASAWWEISEWNVAALLHSEAEGCGKGVESLHQAVEGVDTVGKTEDAGSTTDEEAARGVGGAIAGMDENAGTTGDALQTRQTCAPHFRPRTGRTQKARRGDVETKVVFARRNGGMRSRHRGFEGGDGTQTDFRRQQEDAFRSAGKDCCAAKTK